MQFEAVVLVGETILSQKQISEEEVYMDVMILEPNFWWPNGIGKPYIYDFIVQIRKGDQVID